MTVDQAVAQQGVIAHAIVGQLGTAEQAELAVFASGFLSARAPELLAEIVGGYLDVRGSRDIVVPRQRVYGD